MLLVVRELPEHGALISICERIQRQREYLDISNDIALSHQCDVLRHLDSILTCFLMARVEHPAKQAKYHRHQKGPTYFKSFP